MAQNAFSMRVQKAGRMKYLLLAMGIPILLMHLFKQLATADALPSTGLLSQVYIYSPIFIMAVLGYFLIHKKNHCIDVKNNTLIETDWRGKNRCVIKTEQIWACRRNILGEIILLDKHGTRLLCVESNMSNFDAFQQWLVRHNILDKKEK